MAPVRQYSVYVSLRFDGGSGQAACGPGQSRQQPGSSRLFIAVPIIADGETLGTLLVVNDTSTFWFRFLRLIVRALWITLIVLSILLPINWYWGQLYKAFAGMVAQLKEKALLEK